MCSLPRVSIALATYNGADYLLEQLQSLAQQTLQPHELVVGDDCSTDGTLQILSSFAEIVSFPVRVQRNTHRLGYAVNFLEAASRCQGDVIAFCDQDDVWLPSKLQQCAEAYAEPGLMLVVHPVENVDVHLRSLSVTTPNVRQRTLVPQGKENPMANLVAGCAMVAHHSLVGIVRNLWSPSHMKDVRAGKGYNLFSHDRILMYAANSLGSICYLTDALVQHRHHERNTATGPVSFSGRIRQTLNVGTEAYGKLAAQAEREAIYFSEMSENSDGMMAVVFSKCASHALELMDVAKARARLYESGTRIDRFAMMQHMLKSGIYAKVGLRALAKDLFRAIS